MKIKDVSERYDITADTLRYYERIGLIRNVPRNSAGIRDYSDENCETIEFIKCMRGANISIEGLTKYMDLYHQGDDTQAERKAILIAEREKLTQRMAAMQSALERLNHKIATYDDWTDGRCHKQTKKQHP